MSLPRLAAAVLLAAALAACAVLEPTPSKDEVSAFSANREGDAVPRGWQPLIITRAKAPTQYRLVYDERTVDLAPYIKVAVARFTLE